MYTSQFTWYFISMVFALTILLTACSWGRRAQEPALKDEVEVRTIEISVMSFNIRYGTADDGSDRWENRKDLVAAVIRKYRPDLIGVQEALHFQIQELLRALPAYRKIGVGRDDGQTEGEYSAMYYDTTRFMVEEHNTFWFSETPRVPGSTDWGNEITRICTWGRFREMATGTGFYVYNLHLDHQSQYSRERSVASLISRIQDRGTRDPVIITGDFNAGEDNPVIKYLKGEQNPGGIFSNQTINPIPFTDSYRVLHPNAERVGTFNGFKGRTTGPKIDHVFVQPFIEVKAAEIIRDHQQGRYPSDHFPVRATLLLPVE